MADQDIVNYDEPEVAAEEAEMDGDEVDRHSPPDSQDGQPTQEQSPSHHGSTFRLIVGGVVILSALALVVMSAVWMVEIKDRVNGVATEQSSVVARLEGLDTLVSALKKANQDICNQLGGTNNFVANLAESQARMAESVADAAHAATSATVVAERSRRAAIMAQDSARTAASSARVAQSRADAAHASASTTLDSVRRVRQEVVTDLRIVANRVVAISAKLDTTEIVRRAIFADTLNMAEVGKLPRNVQEKIVAARASMHDNARVAEKALRELEKKRAELIAAAAKAATDTVGGSRRTASRR